MKLSTKIRYGLRILIAIGVEYDENKYVQLINIAKSEGISEKYAEQIVRILKINGLVKSQRGIQGGYTLSKNPEEITLLNIYEALEGKLNLIDCLNCDRKFKCVTTNVWSKLTENIANTLNSITLKDLIDDFKKNNKNILNFEI